MLDRTEMKKIKIWSFLGLIKYTLEFISRGYKYRI